MIRKGMWCVDSEGRIGIVNALAGDGSAEFHHVEPNGTTSLAVVVDQTELVQARYREIPESRRKLTQEQFVALGYA